MLSYYGCKTLEEFAEDIGMNRIDALRKLKDMYEEDMLWEDYEEVTA
jgi:hypothetical protein